MHVNKPSRTKNSTAKRLASTLTLAEDDGKERLIHATFSLEPDIHRRLKMESARSGVPMSRMLTEWIKKTLSGGKIRRYDGAGSSERRNTLDSEGIETWCTSSTGPSTGSCGTCRRRDVRSTGLGARRHELHPGRPRGRRVQTHREGLAQWQDTFHRPQRAAALGPVPWRYGLT